MTGWWRKVTGANDAAEASQAAAAESVAGQTDALNYLKETEQYPLEIRDYALKGLSETYGPPGQHMTQEQLIAQAKGSPLYDALMGSRRSGEQAILRNASATGGLRSAAPSALAYDYNVQLENDALLKSFQEATNRDNYLRSFHTRGLEGLAGVNTNQEQVAQTMSNIGETRAQGILGSAQARQAGNQSAIDTGLGIASLVAMFSDIRLKEDVQPAGELMGHKWYRWKWNKTAQEKFGLKGEGVGVIAHHLHEIQPDAVTVRDGYLAVDYSKLRAA